MADSRRTCDCEMECGPFLDLVLHIAVQQAAQTLLIGRDCQDGLLLKELELSVREQRSNEDLPQGVNCLHMRSTPTISLPLSFIIVLLPSFHLDIEC